MDSSNTDAPYGKKKEHFWALAGGALIIIGVTLSTRNPNHLIRIFYEKLGLHAIYRNQRITLATPLPNVPISPLLADLVADLKSGSVPLPIKINGRLKWKISSSMIPGIYQLIVHCPAYVLLRKPRKVDSAVKCEFVEPCKVIVN
ncbi:unnamed protein product [Dovyalis caffra]|uniref:Uncharacterized protein n=1 Tax=Dovyalis caffra TaxID=77055 RepID=A0AAV1RPZ0_9ROSI|nr:unnamed protein product [Dovyalis caffra]